MQIPQLPTDWRSFATRALKFVRGLDWREIWKAALPLIIAGLVLKLCGAV